MKIRADRKSLAETIGWVAQAIPRNVNTAALAGIRLRAESDRLTLSAFDYAVAHEARVSCEVVSEGECLVPGAFLRTIVGALRGNDVELVLDDGALTVTSGRSTYRARTLSLAEYPNLPGLPPAMGTLDGATLADAVVGCMGPIDDDHPTEAIRGLRIEAGDELNLVGVEGRFIAHRALAWDGSEFEATIPGKAASAATSGLAGIVTIGASESAVSFTDAERSVVIRKLAVKFVDWRRVPRDEEDDRFAVEVERDDLAEAVKRAALLTRTAKDEARVILTIEPDSIEVTANDDTSGGAEIVDATSGGREVIHFNPDLIVRALAAMKRGTVRLGVGPRRSPDMGAFLTIRPVQYVAGDEALTVIAARKGGEVR